MSKRGNKEFVLDMLLACKKIIDYTKGLSYEEFRENDLIIDAIIRNIEILGEAAKSVSEDFKEKYKNVEWKEIAKTRDKIIHFYFGVNLSIIWDIITIDIPALKKKLEDIVKMEGWISE